MQTQKLRVCSQEKHDYNFTIVFGKTCVAEWLDLEWKIYARLYKLMEEIRSTRGIGSPAVDAFNFHENFCCKPGKI